MERVLGCSNFSAPNSHPPGRGLNKACDSGETEVQKTAELDLES